jgi:hypothetical protein
MKNLKFGLTNNTGESHMKTTGYFFLIGAIVELIAGVALLTVYDNALGYMGLIASVLLMAMIPLFNKVEG